MDAVEVVVYAVNSVFEVEVVTGLLKHFYHPQVFDRNKRQQLGAQSMNRHRLEFLVEPEDRLFCILIHVSAVVYLLPFAAGRFREVDGACLK